MLARFRGWDSAPLVAYMECGGVPPLSWCNQHYKIKLGEARLA